jgi:phytol kinase
MIFPVISNTTVPLAIAVLVVFALLIASEVWWRKRDVHDEFSRKLVHITVGSFVAFWPFFLSWGQIQLLSVAFLITVAISKRLHIFRAIHSVQRPTWGELYFALAVGSITLITHDKWLYMAAILQMSLADGLAAVIGVRYGQRQAYKVLGHTKTLAGSATFFVISVAILIAFTHYSAFVLGPLQIAGLAAVATVIENFGIQGLDNLLVPVVVAIGLKLLV